MRSRSLTSRAGGASVAGLAALLLTARATLAQEKERPKTDQIPARVMGALKARFPGAEIDKWTRETEGDTVLYDIEFKQRGRKFEADIRQDGTIRNWERAIAARDLPDAVRKAVEGRYPRSRLTEVMVITAVVDGKDVVEGYEIVLATTDRKEVEVTVAPDGTILEDSGPTPP
jgi:uncharacterized membrane protein YkoI